VAVNVCEYATPIVPEGRLLVEIVIAGAAMVILSAFVADPPLVSAARTVNCEVPAVCGVPLIVPEGLKESPPGRDPPVNVHE
jgi:hypothetical protein